MTAPTSLNGRQLALATTVAIVIAGVVLVIAVLPAEYGIDPALMHRLTTISAGTLDALPHNGTVLLLLQISKQTHAGSYFDMVMTVIVGVVISLIAVFILGSMFGSF